MLSSRARAWSRVYPRVCGGTRHAAAQPVPGAGLSPRVRGNLHKVAECAVAGRSIPACAGEPHARSAPASASAVYPRVCGGTMYQRIASSPASGLSPRVRGNPLLLNVSRPGQGSIPACAGEPGNAHYRHIIGMVYPRVCGGTSAVYTVHRISRGLSPRVRGNQRTAGAIRTSVGSIPACAGEPRIGNPAPKGGGVYPRVCGGTGYAPTRNISKSGLSPRVRGNPSEIARSRPRRRSIPACAGEPAAASPAVRPA